MKTNIRFWLVLLLFFNAAAYAVDYSEIITYNDEPRFVSLQRISEYPLQTVLLTSANAFVVTLATVFYFLEKFRDKEEDRRMNENKREARRRYYRRRAERRKKARMHECIHGKVMKLEVA